MSATKPKKPPNFPSWLPKEVNEHAKRLMEIGGLNKAEPLLIRLVSSPDMEKVWKKLSESTETPQKLIDFLEFVRLHSSLQGNATDPIDIPSDKLQRAAFLRAEKSARDILKVLGSLPKSGDPDHGWSLLESALIRSELEEINKPSQFQFLEIKELQSLLKSIQKHGSVSDFIKIIARASEIAASAPDTGLPVRRNSPRAKANLLILDLKSHLKHCFYLEKADSLIAATVNTAFIFRDGGISADDVHKLNP